MAIDHVETFGEEVANSVSHGIGALLSLSALVLMVTFASFQHSAWKVSSCAIFGVALILMYSASSIYHALRQPQVKQLFKILDHASIYLLIAGSYTPFTLVTLRGVWGWVLFGVIWGLAIVGVLGKVFYRNKGEVLSTLIYLAMGWLVIVAIVPLLHALPWGGIYWLVLGGLCYTLGVIFFFLEEMPFNHMVWHLFVLAGSMAHVFAVMFYVIPAVR